MTPDYPRNDAKEPAKAGFRTNMTRLFLAAVFLSASVTLLALGIAASTATFSVVGNVQSTEVMVDQLVTVHGAGVQVFEGSLQQSITPQHFAELVSSTRRVAMAVDREI